MGDTSALGGIFSSCVFAFVPSSSLPASLIDELSQSIANCDGEVIQLKRNGNAPLLDVTHIISNTIDFPQYQEAQAMMIPVVKHRWIASSIQRNKQSQLRPFSPDPRMIFSDVVVTCADIPTVDRDTIIGATMAMGGMENDSVTKLTTHICALSMDHVKCRIAVEKKLKCKIVLPHWFDDCFRLGKRIDEGPYLLPDPEILRSGSEGEINVPSSQHLEGATSARPDYLPTPTDTPARPRLTVFNNRKLMLSSDLSISDRLKSIISDLIVQGGGVVTDSVDSCDMLICHYRDGEHYVRASHDGKDVGNLSWLYWLITHNEWTSPLRRLLHYPLPRDGIPGFQGLRITVSNYGGEARIYLENLILAAGATFTKTMKADNTHLITARDNSEKCEAARDWNINMVNHLWIEESYARCELQTLSVPKYTHFPPRTNLGEIIGQTFLDEAKLRALYYPCGPEQPTPAASRKRKMLDAAQDNAYSMGPAEGVVIGRQARHKEFEVMQESAEDLSGSKQQKRASFATPARRRQVGLGKENATPSTVGSSGRSAKDKALNRLHDLAPDIALYEKEKKRGLKDGYGLWGGKRAADLIEKENDARRRTSSPTREVNDEEEEDAEARPAKKHKKELPEIDARVMLTFFDRWTKNSQKEDTERKKLRSLGIHIVSESQPCDYLVAPRIVRGTKFLYNLTKGVTILSSTWIEEILDTGKIPDPQNHVLKDLQTEKKYGLNLRNSVSRARQNKGRLLWNVPIYCTAEIKNGPDSYRPIAEANGAIFKIYRARSGTTIRPTNPEDDDDGPDPVYLLTSPSPEEKRLWPKFEEMARAGNMEPRIVSSDWLLNLVLKQEAPKKFDEQYLATNSFKP